MSKIYDERGKGFEKKFQMDEELQFKVAARSNKYLGEWVSVKLRKNEEEKKNFKNLATLLIQNSYNLSYYIL